MDHFRAAALTRWVCGLHCFVIDMRGAVCRRAEGV